MCSKPSALSVVTGTNTLWEEQSGETTYVVVFIKHHEEFDFSSILNDVALVQVGSDIKYTPKIQPIPLNRADIGEGEDLVLSGWGTTTYPGNLPNKLQFIELKSISVKDCQEMHAPLQVHDTHICTLTKAGEGACHGDSGGPLVYKGRVAGIVSWGRPCAVGYPDVFTRVSKYVGWIEKNMAQNVLP